MLSLEQPDNAPCDSGTYRKGETLKASSTAGYLTKTTDKGDTVVAVVAESVVDEKGVLRTTAAGDGVPVWEVGSRKTVQVRSLTGVSWSPSDVVYQDDTNGQVSKTATTSRPIGHYARYGFAAKSVVEQRSGVGGLIWVTLDYDVGATLV